MARKTSMNTDADNIIKQAQQAQSDNIADELAELLHPSPEADLSDIPEEQYPDHSHDHDHRHEQSQQPDEQPTNSQTRQVDAFDLKSGSRIEAELIDNIEHALNFQDGEINRNKALLDLLDDRLKHYEDLAKTVEQLMKSAKKKRKQVHASLTAALTAKSMLEAQRTNDDE